MNTFTFQERIRLREVYKFVEPQILNKELTDVYSIWPHDWMAYMSPIEQEFFGWLRLRDARGYWPQYPCGPYFMDFASPIAKICIELDGKAYHLDKVRDQKREDYIREQGYRIVRLTGREVHQMMDGDTDELYDEDGNEVFYEHPLSIRMAQIIRGESW